MKALLDWVDERTGAKKLLHEALFENVPGGARWRYVWGSTLVFTFVVQVITGVFLWMQYSPSAQTAASKPPSSPRSSALLRAVATQSQPASAQVRAVRSTMFCDRSVASTWPAGPTALAIAVVTSPLPQAASITRSPGLMLAIRRSVCCAGASGRRHPSS